MATYLQIQEHVEKANGFVPKTCWIADVKNQYGLTKRVAPNRQSLLRRKHPCPAVRRDAIVCALKHFNMI
jgi:hypothetical protein